MRSAERRIVNPFDAVFAEFGRSDTNGLSQAWKGAESWNGLRVCE